MTRKLKALGLALMAVAAMSSIAAQAAQAAPELTTGEAGAATIHGTGEGIGEKFTTEAGSVECAVSHYHATLPEPSSTLTVEPQYTECQAFGFVSATVNTEECHYVFHATEKVELHYYRAHVDVVCPAGQSIKITASTCKAEVKPQSGLTTVDITNMTNAEPVKDDITVKPTLTGPEGEMDGKHGPVAYTVTQDGFLCPFSGTGNKTGGEYSTTGYVTITAEGRNLSVIGE